MKRHKKGMSKEFIDGGGFPSLGRWAMSRRVLPDDDLARELQGIMKKCPIDSEPHLPGGFLRQNLSVLASGSCHSDSFPKDIADRVRADLRIAPRKGGYSDGLPRLGDVEQKTEVRLLQALLRAFGDPDWYFVDWWAKGVWIGSPEKRLPRTPSLYEKDEAAKIGQVGAAARRLEGELPVPTRA